MTCFSDIVATYQLKWGNLHIPGCRTAVPGLWELNPVNVHDMESKRDRVQVTCMKEFRSDNVMVRAKETVMVHTWISMHGHYHLYVLLHHFSTYCSWSIRDTDFIVPVADHLCSLVFLVAIDEQSQALQVAFCSRQMGRNVTLPVPSQGIMVHLAHQLKENNGSLHFHADSLASQFTHI